MCFLFPEYPVTVLTRTGGEKERVYVREGLTEVTGAWWNSLTPEIMPFACTLTVIKNDPINISQPTKQMCLDVSVKLTKLNLLWLTVYRGIFQNVWVKSPCRQKSRIPLSLLFVKERSINTHIRLELIRLCAPHSVQCGSGLWRPAYVV